jgi:enterobacterial common antigen flippase
MPSRLRFFRCRYERPAHSDHSALLHLSFSASQRFSIYPLKLPNSSSSPAAPGQPEDHAAESPSSIQNPKSNIQNPAEGGTSYGQILRSSSIIGGATGINYVIGMVRTKAVAVLLGPSGIGLVGLYISITGLVSTIAQLGIDQSGVREVAAANGSGDPERVARVTKTLRRVCWLTGILGWILTVALAWPLSQWTFGSAERMWAVAILGVTVLIGAVTGGQTALLQGMRRIGDLARIQVLSAIITTFVAIGLYAWLGERGIIPVLILSSVVQLGFSWYFSRRIQISKIPQTWTETTANAKRLVGLGSAFMYGALLAAIVGLAIRSLIVRDLGLDANGIYQAAWGLSGMFAGFILGAMGADYYPRLTAVANDNEQVNRLVNEQIEVGVLLALPGLLGTLAFAPWLMHAFYSAKFLSGADLLPWLAVGVFAQLITFPMGYIQRAKGQYKWIYVSQTHVNLLNLVLAYVLITRYGVIAASWAFALTTCIHGLVTFGIARHLSDFAWSRCSMRLILAAATIISSSYVSQMLADGVTGYAIGALITAAGCIFSLRGIYSRLGADHRLVKMALKIPGGNFACGSQLPQK